MLNPRTNRRPLTRFARFGRLGVLVLVSIVVAGLQVGSVSRSAESTGNAVDQEQRPAEPSSKQIAEPVARATGLQEQLQTVLDEQQALLGDSDRPPGRSTEPIRVGDGVRPPAKIHKVTPVHPPEARTGIQGAVEVDDIEVVRSIPALDEADEGHGGAHTVEADAGDRSYKVRTTRRASTLERELNTTATAGAQTPGEVFRDCDVCPEMVVLPGADVALGRFEVTLEEFRAFAEAVPDAAPEPPCGSSQLRRRRSWRAAGYLQTERHPVACVSWNDAQAYVGWLSLETGHSYRLPTEAEWDRGAAGSPKGCNQFFTKELGTCVVGSYPPSDAGIFDMVGNLREWTNDCWDSQALVRNGDCGRKVVRGAGWESLYWRIVADARRLAVPDLRGNWIGFRVARTLP